MRHIIRFSIRSLVWFSKRGGWELGDVHAEMRRAWYSAELMAKIGAFNEAIDTDEHGVAQSIFDELRNNEEIDGAELVGMSTDLAFLAPSKETLDSTF